MTRTVTSQVAQTITLNEEYQIDKIYVSAGDTVKEGTPLFSYDMTLPELELEMAELDLQAKELEKVKLEKDLDKLKKTKTSAALEQDAAIKTASADEISPLPKIPRLPAPRPQQPCIKSSPIPSVFSSQKNLPSPFNVCRAGGKKTRFEDRGGRGSVTELFFRKIEYELSDYDAAKHTAASIREVWLFRDKA